MNLLRALAIILFLGAPAFAAELVMVEEAGCPWCARWNAEIGPAYPNTEEGRRAPLRRVDLHALPGDVAFATPPRFTPTFVLVEGGRELGRIEGYPGDEFFWVLLTRLLEALPAPKGGT